MSRTIRSRRERVLPKADGIFRFPEPISPRDQRAGFDIARVQRNLLKAGDFDTLPPLDRPHERERIV
jgi:hypothetical protein